MKPITQADNTTEFLMLTLQVAFNIEPAQVAELIGNKNQYLLQACDKGFRRDFKPVITWYEMMVEAQNFSTLVNLFHQAFA